MEKKLSLSLITAAVALATTSVLAAERGQANRGYAGDSHGIVVFDSSGNCVRTSSWTREMATPVCDADLLPRLAAVEPAPEPIAKPAPVAKPIVEKMTLREETLFDTGKAELRPNGKAELDKLAATLLEQGVDLEHIYVTGHASAPGTKNFNQLLSERRADSVKAYLASKGIDPARIFTQGMGETRPVASNATREGRALNRRVELEIKAKRTTMSAN